MIVSIRVLSARIMLGEIWRQNGRYRFLFESAAPEFRAVIF